VNRNPSDKVSVTFPFLDKFAGTDIVYANVIVIRSKNYPILLRNPPTAANRGLTNLDAFVKVLKDSVAKQRERK
jgi:hypothetical protein